MSEFTILHNPRCSKSRMTLALLEENGIQPEVQFYLESTPNVAELAAIVAKLDMNVRDLLRKGEQAYKEQGLKDMTLTDEQLLAAMVASPKLIERPIVIKGDKAVVGRPPENVLSLIE